MKREYTERREYDRAVAGFGPEARQAHRLAGAAMTRDRAVETALTAAR